MQGPSFLYLEIFARGPEQAVNVREIEGKVNVVDGKRRLKVATRSIPTTASQAGRRSIERLENTLRMLAYIVVRHGEVHGPLLERVERELDEARRRPSHRDRAQQILAQLTREANLA